MFPFRSSNSRWTLALASGSAAGIVAMLFWWRRSRRGCKSCLRISKLCVYPVKSCRGVHLDEVKLTREGLAHDREFAIVRVTSEGKAEPLTQREVAQMALLVPQMPTSDELVVRKEGMPPLVAKTLCDACAVVYSMRLEEVWGEDAVAYGVDLGEEAATWFCRALDMPNLRLVRFTGTRPAPSPEKFGEGYTRLSDGFPMLLTSEASLVEIERRSGISNMLERTRPNIVVAGCDTHEEDTWTELHWQRDEAFVKLRLPKPCARCTIPRVNPATGVPGSDPARFLKGYRSGRKLLEDDTPHKKHYGENKGEIFFGQNVNIITESDVILRVGDTLQPLT
eukprot:TRINITY_DN12404_c0_g3_i1.p1 TRINITY_DN12404_c0_g3~~TRINITY_DN12404_c0_g3_i1.p1  ORF type:complete len:337 (-),score=43.88 TRINITY_DN12404_c0_g3_i1:55-1065(-)